MMALFNSMNGEGEGPSGEGRRYMFALELKAGSRTEYKWTPELALENYKPQGIPEAQETEMLRHTLLLRRAVVGSSAKENEGNLVSVEVEDPDVIENTAFPLVYLAKGKEAQAPIDLTFPEVNELGVTFTLSEGSGPVHIIGYHFVERVPGDYNSEAEDDDMDGEGEENVDEDEPISKENITEQLVEKVKAVVGSAKRRLNENGNAANGAAKKAKVQDENEEMEKEPEPVEAAEK
jgi:nucleophosmin 3